MSISQLTPMKTDLERLSDVLKVCSLQDSADHKLSAHVTRVLGQNPGLMTLQGTNSYLLQPPSNPLAPLILIDTSSPHTSQQYVDLFFTHLSHLGLESGTRETHFESRYAKDSLSFVPKDKVDEVKAQIVGEHAESPNTPKLALTEYGDEGRWEANRTKDRRLPPVEHIILTHRHLDHVGALPHLLKKLKDNGLPPPRIWKIPSPDEMELVASERDRPTADSVLIQALPKGTYVPFSPFQPIHPILPGLMISIIDPVYKHLLKHDKDGKPKWNEVPEIARVSLRCLRTPGHTADSVSLVMCEGEKGVFTGDTVLGQGTTIFTDLAAYTTSLKTLLALKPSVLYPAHGPHIVTAEKCATFLQDYLTHRQQREVQIISLLKSISDDPTLLTDTMAELKEKYDADQTAENKYQHEFLSGKPYKPNKEKEERVQEEKEKADKVEEKFPAESTGITIPLMCRMLYKTDQEGIIYAAGRSVLAHLEKLEKEGKVERVTVRLPKVVEWKISDPLEQEGWELVREGGDLGGSGDQTRTDDTGNEKMGS